MIESEWEGDAPAEPECGESVESNLVRREMARREPCPPGLDFVGGVDDQKLAALDELKQSILQKAFTGQLTSKSKELELVP